MVPWWETIRSRQKSSSSNNNKKKKYHPEPEPRIIEDFLTAEEAALLLQRYEPLLRASWHMGSTGETSSSHYRTSQSVRLPQLGDPLVFDIERRAAAAAFADPSLGHHHPHAIHPYENNNNNNNHTHLPVEVFVEDFQLACYGVDDLYGLHRDDNNDAVHRADRIATVLIYLEAPVAGGTTLFTRRPMEDEGTALRTEAAALELFRQYCAHPPRTFVVVEPVVGRAVTWPNWYGTNASQFCHASTHGACPVRDGGQKCVIQQVSESVGRSVSG